MTNEEKTQHLKESILLSLGRLKFDIEYAIEKFSGGDFTGALASLTDIEVGGPILKEAVLNMELLEHVKGKHDVFECEFNVVAAYEKFEMALTKSGFTYEEGDCV